MLIFLYLLAFLLLTFVFLILIYLFGDFLMHFWGAPFVPTSKKDLAEIFKKAQLKKGQVFIELGSGDGRGVIMAAQKYGTRSIGIEGHPLLWLYSIILSKLTKTGNATFKRQNFFKSNLEQANVLYLFLSPKTLKKLGDKILKDCGKNTLIISHGFKMEGFEKYLAGQIERKIYNTYFYRLG